MMPPGSTTQSAGTGSTQKQPGNGHTPLGEAHVPIQVRFAVVGSDVTGGWFPLRGCSFSLVLHALVVAALIFVHPKIPINTPQQIVSNYEVQPLTGLLLPDLRPALGGKDGAGPAAADQGREGTASVVSRVAPAGPPGPDAAYQGLQEIISNPPAADNAIQTIRQPDLVAPPKLKFLAPVPTQVLIAHAEAPKLAAPLKPIPLSVKPPAAPEVPAPRVQLKSELKDLAIAAPQAIIPVAPPPPVRPLPSAPAAPITIEQGGSAVADGGGNDQKNLLVVNAVPMIGPDTPPPAGERAGQFAFSPETHAVPNGKPTGGTDAGAGSAPSPPTSTGDTATEHVLTSASAVGSSATANGSEHGVGSGHSGAGAGSASASSGHGNGLKIIGGSSGNGTGTGNGNRAASGFGTGSGKGTGSGTGDGSAAGSKGGNSPFKGITIAGGSATGSGSLRGGSTTGSGYGLTIIGSGASGGGLKDYGVFHNETVYTVYLSPADVAGRAPNWSMQYAILSASSHPGQVDANTAAQPPHGLLSAPYPVAKRIAEFPPEMMARYRGRMVAVAAQIDAEGKFRNLRFVQSPGPDLESLIAGVLSKWEFHPAEVNHQPVAVKVLLGIPVQ
ncbi:MAG TPA: hypothetical protein VE734_13170 [Terriglobales bacterium]|nr:hypothetical protein [Terriglobales bacterium]